MTQVSQKFIDVVLLAIAIPVWALVFLMVIGGPGFAGRMDRFLIPPIVLGGMTCALHRVMPRYRHAWSLAALLAPILAISVILLVSEALRRWS